MRANSIGFEVEFKQADKNTAQKYVALKDMTDVRDGKKIKAGQILEIDNEPQNRQFLAFLSTYKGVAPL